MNQRKKGDQEFIEKQLELKDDMSIKIARDYINIASYKRQCLSGNYPDSTSIVGFHGKPRPQDVTTDWVEEHYR